MVGCSAMPERASRLQSRRSRCPCRSTSSTPASNSKPRSELHRPGDLAQRNELVFAETRRRLLQVAQELVVVRAQLGVAEGVADLVERIHRGRGQEHPPEQLVAEIVGPPPQLRTVEPDVL